MFNLNEDQTKLLARILVDAPAKGDGQRLIALLDALEIDSLKRSRGTKDEVESRWFQGESIGYQLLQKKLQESKDS